ncbi:hypothetical protein [Allokutzneria sp. NRRL B-24872]|uniref:hypothetical protein n=1 Tax=Allokutzneria sp. NRRL B-24872 TaxID=1137961 RepID=UPI000A393F01|nr:hypothetical protein [Allokutzneria sp. NRRL B-24872]
MEPNTDIDRLQELPETEPEPETTTDPGGPGDPGVVRPYTSGTLFIGDPEPEDIDAEFVAEFGDGAPAPEADETAKA